MHESRLVRAAGAMTRAAEHSIAAFAPCNNQLVLAGGSRAAILMGAATQFIWVPRAFFLVDMTAAASRLRMSMCFP
jgi:hypothetical protein